VYFTVLGLYTNIDSMAKTMDPLEKLAIAHSDIRLLSAAPYPEGALFHDHRPVPLAIFAFVFALGGLFTGLAVAGGTQMMMNLVVSGKPMFSYPPVGIICYEFTLLGAIIGTLVGMLWVQGLPDWTDRAYDTDIFRGKIGLLVKCRDEEEARMVEKVMVQNGAVRTKQGRDDF
jgi:hypothetical protein